MFLDEQQPVHNSPIYRHRIDWHDGRRSLGYCSPAYAIPRGTSNPAGTNPEEQIQLENMSSINYVTQFWTVSDLTILVHVLRLI